MILRTGAGWLLSGILLMAGCSQQRTAPLLPETARMLSVYRTTTDPGTWSASLDEKQPGLALFSFPNLAAAIEKSLQENRILMIADIAGLREEEWSRLAAAIDEGLPVLMCGPNPQVASLPPEVLQSSGLKLFETAYDFTFDRLVQTIEDRAALDCDGTYGQSVMMPVPDDAADSPWRWVPMFEGYAYPDQLKGWPGSLFILREGGPERPARRWGWIGIQVAEQPGRSCAWMLDAAVKRLGAPAMLNGFPSLPHTLKPLDPISIPLTWSAFGAPDREVRVVAELISEGEQQVRRVVSAPVPLSDGRYQLDFGVAPDLGGKSASYTLRLQLRSREDTLTLDEIDRTLKVLPPPEAPDESAWVTAARAVLLLGRGPIFLYGAEYEPIATSGLSAGRAPGWWLHPEVFDGDAFLRDLDLLQNLGMNTVGLTYTDPVQAPQLLWVLDALQQRKLKATIRLAGGDLLQPDRDLLRRLVETADFSLHPEVAVLELSLPDEVAGATADVLEKNWPRWVDAMGAGVDAGVMEAVAGLNWAAAWQSDRAEAVTLARGWLSQFLQHQLLGLTEFLRGLGCRQLITIHPSDSMSAAWPSDRLDASLGGVLVDMVSVSGEVQQFRSLDAEAPRFHALYSRGMAGGKPVIWQNVVRDPTPGTTRREQYLQTVEAAFASGSVGWLAGPWFIESPGLDVASLGLIRSDRAWHPEVSILRSYKNRLRQQRPTIRPWREQTFDPVLLFRERIAVTHAWLSDYSGMFEELRPAGYRISASDWLARLERGEAHRLDVLPCVKALWKKPILYEEEEGSVEIPARTTVHWTLINTGPSRWDRLPAGDRAAVTIRVIPPEGRAAFFGVPDTGFGEVAEIRWEPLTPGRYKLQPWLGERFPVGPVLSVNVTP